LKVWFFALSLFVCSLTHASSFTEEGTKYYAEFYSSQGARFNTARTSHTFVRFYKVVDGERTEVVDISWLPAGGYFSRGGRMPLFRAVPGRNYSLEETFAAVSGRQVFNHGKYEVSPDLFGAARDRKRELESGSHHYKMLDGRSFPSGTNCIHAVSGILGYLNTGMRRGTGATSSVAGMFLSTGHMWPAGRNQVATPKPLPNARTATIAPPPPPSVKSPTHTANTAPAAVASSRPAAFPRMRRVLFGRRGF